MSSEIGIEVAVALHNSAHSTICRNEAESRTDTGMILTDKRILLIISGGIAAYKSVDDFAQAEVDYHLTATGGELNIRAPGLKGEKLGTDAVLEDRVRYTLDTIVNPQLASHGGRVKLEGITSEGVVLRDLSADLSGE